MKKVVLLLMMVAFGSTAVFSQNYIIVNTDTVFRSIDAFNKAVEEIDAYAQSQQNVIDEAYDLIEQMFNEYIANRASMSDTQRRQTEANIAENEQRVLAFQESIFGQEGEIARMRAEKITPLQTNVLNIITRYATDNNLGMVIDISTNPIIIYYSPELDKTEDIIKLLK